jgi:hypothetical protein
MRSNKINKVQGSTSDFRPCLSAIILTNKRLCGVHCSSQEELSLCEFCGSTLTTCGCGEPESSNLFRNHEFTESKLQSDGAISSETSSPDEYCADLSVHYTHGPSQPRLNFFPKTNSERVPDHSVPCGMQNFLF